MDNDNIVILENDDNETINIDPVKYSNNDFGSLANPKRNNNNSDTENNDTFENLDLSDTNEEDSEDDFELNDNKSMNNMNNVNNIINTNDDSDEENDKAEQEYYNNDRNDRQNTFNNGFNIQDEEDSDNSDAESNQYEEEEEEYEEENTKEEKRKNQEYPDVPPENYRERASIKQEILIKLIRLDKAGYSPSKKFTMASSYEDLLFEYRRLKRQRDIEKSIKFSRKVMMAIISGIEFMNNKFDPLSIKLNGWSENVMENITDYDEVFEELHDKYSSSVKMPPEIKLLMMVAGSGFMFHLTNSLFKSATPDLQDILRQNPDIMQNISQAAMKNMNSSAGFDSNDPINKMMMNGANMKNDKNNNLNSLLNKLQSSNNTDPVQKQNINSYGKKDTNGISLDL